MSDKEKREEFISSVENITVAVANLSIGEIAKAYDKDEVLKLIKALNDLSAQTNRSARELVSLISIKQYKKQNN